MTIAFYDDRHGLAIVPANFPDAQITIQNMFPNWIIAVESFPGKAWVFSLTRI